MRLPTPALQGDGDSDHEEKTSPDPLTPVEVPCSPSASACASDMPQRVPVETDDGDGDQVFCDSWCCLREVDTSAARCLFVEETDTGVVFDVDMMETLPQEVSHAIAPQGGNDHGATPQLHVLPGLSDAMLEEPDRPLEHAASAWDEPTGLPLVLLTSNVVCVARNRLRR